MMDKEIKNNLDLDNLVNHHFQHMMLHLKQITDINHLVDLSIKYEALLCALRSKMIERDIENRVKLELEKRKNNGQKG